MCIYQYRFRLWKIVHPSLNRPTRQKDTSISRPHKVRDLDTRTDNVLSQYVSLEPPRQHGPDLVSDETIRLDIKDLQIRR